MILTVLQYEFPAFGGFNELVHVFEELLRSNAGIDLCGLKVCMPQHTADALDGYTLLQQCSWSRMHLWQ